MDKEQRREKFLKENPTFEKWQKIHKENYFNNISKKEKNKAQQKIHIEIRAGRIERESCSICGKKEKIHGHHEDYNQPLEIVWLCQKHHRKRHKDLNRGKRSVKNLTIIKYKNMKEEIKKVEKEISEHFKKLGLKSWESRKIKLLEKVEKEINDKKMMYKTILIPEDLYLKLKTQALNENKKINEVIESLIEDYLEMRNKVLMNQ